MRYLYQRTISKPVKCSGIGAHSGKKVNITIKPAPENNGIKFVRTDLPGNPCVKAIYNAVVDTSLATVIGGNGIIVSTIEHLMAAFTGFSIDNAIVEIDGYEVPILDGSASLYSKLLKKAGAAEQNGLRYYFVIKKPIILEDDGKTVGFYPDSEYKISCSIDFNHPMIKKQDHTVTINQDNFVNEVCSARTFGFLHEFEFLKRYGLARGVTIDSGLAFDNDSILNEDGFRYKNECVRHKLLDCIGDFSLIGMPIIGHIKSNKSGHAFNHAFIEKFFQHKDSWETRHFKNSEKTSTSPSSKSLAI